MIKPAVVTRTITRFRNAVLADFEKGSIPVYSNDREEQELIDATRDAIDLEYERAELALRRLINRRW